MVKLLLPYYQALKQDDLIQQAVAAWALYSVKINDFDKKKLIIPSKYKLYLEALIKIFQEETFSHGTHDFLKLSNKTESALSALFNVLLPKQAVKLDDYLDIELFLLAAFRTVTDCIFRSEYQKDAFYIRVVGLIQSTLHPEAGKLFCQSLNQAKSKYPQIVFSKRALSHQLKEEKDRYSEVEEGENFYRASREARIGLGFDFYCGEYGEKTSSVSWLGNHLEKIMLKKDTEFSSIFFGLRHPKLRKQCEAFLKMLNVK
jgi:hypothetical protein